MKKCASRSRHEEDKAFPNNPCPSLISPIVMLFFEEKDWAIVAEDHWFADISEALVIARLVFIEVLPALRERW
jgi:hypothetical protein